MGEGGSVILQVFLIFVAAKVAGEVFIRLRLPALAGELLVGIVLGPHVAGTIHINQATTALSDVGIVVLLFTVGLETPLSGLLSVGRTAMTSSVTGILVAGGSGFLVVRAFGFPTAEALLAGAALAASSVGVAARIFSDLELVRTIPARTVLGAAVIDDVLVLATLPIVQGLSGSDTSTSAILVGLGGVVGFIVLVAVVGTRLARTHGHLLDHPRVGRSPFVLALGLCLGLAAVAESVGLAALVGAFLAGMVLAETNERYELDRRMQPLYDFLVPFFFVLAGAAMDPSRVVSGGWGFATVLIVVTLVAKLTGCGLAAVGLSWRERLQVGSAMVPRTEVTLVVAAAGAATGALSTQVFAVLVAAALVTTLAAPAMLRLAIPHERPAGEAGA